MAAIGAPLTGFRRGLSGGVEPNIYDSGGVAAMWLDHGDLAHLVKNDTDEMVIALR